MDGTLLTGPHPQCVYLLPSGAKVPLEDLGLIRDGDELLLRAGGEPRVCAEAGEAKRTRAVRVNAKVPRWCAAVLVYCLFECARAG